MRPNIHPETRPVAFRDRQTGTVFVLSSTCNPSETLDVDGTAYPVVHCDVTADSHPFWTGTARVLDSEGRVEAYRRRYGTRS